MLDPLDNGLFDIPDYEHIQDERFPPLPPPHSPGQGGSEAEVDPFTNGEAEGDISMLPEVPAAKKRGVKRPQPKLDSQRLTSERGLPALRTLFDNVQFKGKGHEAEDLRLLIQKMENWAHRLYPKLQFDDFIDKVEKLGSKKEVQTCLKRIRLDMPLTHEDFIGKEDDTGPREEHVLGDPDPFGAGGFPDEPPTQLHSTPAPASTVPSLTEEQRRRIELNKQLALERRLARAQQHTDASSSQLVSSTPTTDEPSTSSSSQFLDRPEDQEQDLHVDQGSEEEQPKEMALDKDTELLPDSLPHEKGESSLSTVPQLSNGFEDSD